MRPRTLRSLGEDAVVAALIRDLPLRPDVQVGAGDDCAVIGGPRDRLWVLLKTDAVVESVHFSAETEPHRVGWKALCRAISDIAAMGGEPQHALVTLVVRPEVPLRWVEGLYAGLRKAALRFGVAIVGGETSRSPGPLFLSIALTGVVARRHCVKRSGGDEGDWLYVTGCLGGSLAGHHLDFTPRVKEGRWLAQRGFARAMMDVSDGIAADAPRLAAASGCDVEWWPSVLPCRAGCDARAAASDGEDFELLLAVAPNRAAALEREWKRAFPKTRLTRIGVLTARGRRDTKVAHGYDHFA